MSGCEWLLSHITMVITTKVSNSSAGDGTADFLWVDKFSGDADVYYNSGEDASRPSGSAFRFTPAGSLYLGAAQG